MCFACYSEALLFSLVCFWSRRGVPLAASCGTELQKAKGEGEDHIQLSVCQTAVGRLHLVEKMFPVGVEIQMGRLLNPYLR